MAMRDWAMERKRLKVMKKTEWDEVKEVELVCGISIACFLSDPLYSLASCPPHHRLPGLHYLQQTSFLARLIPRHTIPGRTISLPKKLTI